MTQKQSTADKLHEVWCRQQWQTVPRAGRTPNSYPPRLPINPPGLEVGMMHKIILLVLAGYSSKEAYARAEVEEELRQRENTIAALLKERPALAEAVEEGVHAIYALADLSINQIGAIDRWLQGLSAKQIAREMSQNKDRPEVTVAAAESWVKHAKAKLGRLGDGD